MDTTVKTACEELVEILRSCPAERLPAIAEPATTFSDRVSPCPTITTGTFSGCTSVASTRNAACRGSAWAGGSFIDERNILVRARARLFLSAAFLYTRF